MLKQNESVGNCIKIMYNTTYSKLFERKISEKLKSDDDVGKG